jgi:hypothetical protein
LVLALVLVLGLILALVLVLGLVLLATSTAASRGIIATAAESRCHDDHY